MKASSAIPSSGQTEGITTSKKSICTKIGALHHVHIRSGTQRRWQSPGRTSPIASVSVPTSITLVSLLPPWIVRVLVPAPAFLTCWWSRRIGFGLGLGLCLRFRVGVDLICFGRLCRCHCLIKDATLTRRQQAASRNMLQSVPFIDVGSSLSSFGQPCSELRLNGNPQVNHHCQEL